MHCAKQHATGRAFVALGSNLDNPQAQLLKAFEDIHALPQTRVLARSALYRSAPVGYSEQPDFINAVVKIETALAPHELLKALLEIGVLDADDAAGSVSYSLCHCCAFSAV